MKTWLKLMVLTVTGAMIISYGCDTAPSAKTKDKKTVQPAAQEQVAKPAAQEQVAKPAVTQKESALRCRYTVGSVERARFANSSQNKVWVEMPDKEPSEPQSNETQREIVLRSEVEKVQEDGSAIIKVTIEQAKVSETVITKETKQTAKDAEKTLKDTKRTNTYSSDAEGTKSTWRNQPKLAGASYKIEIAPDTTVKEIMGLDELRQKLEIGEDDTGKAVSLISEESIKSYHEREFVRYSPDRFTPQQGYDHPLPKNYEKNLPVSNAIIKAKAIKKIYSAQEPQKKNNSQTVTITCQGEPLHLLPEGITEPQLSGSFFLIVTKEKSDMQGFKIAGRGDFDLTTRQVIEDSSETECTLVLDGAKIGFGEQPGKKIEPGSAGFMFTQFNSQSKYELLK